MAVQELSGLLAGQLLVGGSTIPASYFLPTLFGEFHAEHPGVVLKLVTGDSSEIIERVQHADVEVGIVGSDPDSDEFDAMPIGEDELKLILAPDHPLADAGTIRIADLADLPIVMREAGSGTRAATEGALKTVDLHIACEVGSTEAQKAAVQAGLGGAFVSSLAIAHDLKHGTLTTISVKGFQVRRTFHLVSRPEQFLSPAAIAFRDLARTRRLP